MLVQRHLVLLAWMVAGLLLSQTIYFDRWGIAWPPASSGDAGAG